VIVFLYRGILSSESATTLRKYLGDQRPPHVPWSGVEGYGGND
jgi:hypothetical protein